MFNPVVHNKIKLIKIQTKRLMQSSIAGDYSSAIKGTGLEFNQLRDYQPGDDVRFIDWNSSAKAHKIMVKQFIEERDRTIILAIDLSASSRYSSVHELRQDMISQVAATLSYVAHVNKDKVGILFFSDRIEKWIPPSRGSAHLGVIMDTIFSYEPQGTATNIAQALTFLITLKKRNAVVFMISDWIDDQDAYKKLLKVAGIEYDFIGIRVLDKLEKQFPDIGLLTVQDPESGVEYTLDTRKGIKRFNPLNMFLQKRLHDQKTLFEKYRIDTVDITVGSSFIPEIIALFHRRTRKRR